jgi:hypothetical protein
MTALTSSGLLFGVGAIPSDGSGMGELGEGAEVGLSVGLLGGRGTGLGLGSAIG